MGRPTSTSQTNKSNRPVNGIEDGLNQILSAQTDNTRIVMLYGDVVEHTIANSIAQLLHLANINHKPIYLVLSSYGGSVDEMFSLYDTIKFLPCPVHTVALGKVMSAGVLLLAAGTKGQRMIGRTSRLMMHPMSASTYGTIFEVINTTNEYVRMQELMVDSLVSESKMTKETVEGMMKVGHDFYLTPERAIELGIVDRIIGRPL